VESARIVLSYDPDLINAENASGRTVFEIAHSRFLTTITASPPAVTSSLSYRPVVERSPTDLLTEDDLPKQEPRKWDSTDEKGAYALACEAVAATKCGRMLVSLAEANGLAERLQKRKGGTTTAADVLPVLPVGRDVLDLFQAKSAY
jgi:hypothetical protein